MSSSEYESDASDDESFSTIQNDLERMSTMIQLLTENIHDLESAMTTMHRPMESLHLNQLGAVPFLASSPFRHQTFSVKPPGFPGVDLERRYPFHAICAQIRNYLMASNAVQPDGNIILTKPLQKLFDIKTDEPISYLDLIAHLRSVLV